MQDLVIPGGPSTFLQESCRSKIYRILIFLAAGYGNFKLTTGFEICCDNRENILLKYSAISDNISTQQM